MKRIFSTVALLSLLLSCSSDTGTREVGKAVLTSMTPPMVHRGESDIEGRIYGQNLEGMSSLDLGDGIDIHKSSVVSPGELYVLFSVSDGAAPGPRTLTLYAVEGVFSLQQALTVSDNRIPLAVMNVSPPAGYRSTEFRFDASQSADPDGKIDTYRWDFGDGTAIGGKMAVHRFSKSGAFNVALKVTDNGGATATANRFVDVAISQPPQASFTVSPSAGSTDTVFRFDGASSRDPDGHITAYAWNFGDGGTASGATATHRYASTGTFTATLTVTDNTHLPGTLARSIRVDAGGGGDDDDDGGGGTGQECTESASRQPILYGTLVSADESTHSMDVQFPSGTTCREANVRCGDLRKSEPEKFYGIVRRVFDLGGGRFRIYVDCPPSWPDGPGESVFIIYKTCADNFCP